MKVLKWLGVILLLLLIIVAAAMYFALSNIDRIVKEAVETTGPQVVGTSVGLGEVDIQLTDGRAELSDFTVANPAGFSTGNAFELGKIVVDIDPKSLTTDVIVINEILISDVNVFAEQKGIKDTNIEALLDNLKRNSSGGDATDSASESGKQILLAVEKFTFKESLIKVSAEKLGSLDIPIPAVTLTNLGSASNGLTPEQLGKAAVEPYLAKIKSRVRSELKGLAKENVEDKLKEKLKDKLSDSDKENIDKLKSFFK